MNNITDRIRYLMTAEGLKQKDLALQLHASPQTVNNWLKRSAISRDAAQQISEKYGYSLDWLLNGNGEPKGNIPRLAAVGDESASSQWGNQSAASGTVEVPFYGDIEAAISEQEDIKHLSTIRFSKATLLRVGANAGGTGVVCFPANGSSMEPLIPDGTTVAIDRFNTRIIDGDIYAINIDGLKWIRQLYRRPGNKIAIRSFNREEYSDEVLSDPAVQVLGRMFWTSTIW